MVIHDQDVPLESALDALADATAVLDGAGRIVYVNPAFASMLNVKPGIVCGRPAAELAEHSTLNVKALIERLQEGRKAELLVSLGSGRQALASIRRLGADPLTTQGLVVVLRDLAVIDHERQRATSGPAGTTFRFMSQQRFRADLAHQRRLSRDLDRLLTLAERAMLQNARVLLHGESGVGKTEIARYLHEYAATAPTPFVHVNCGAIPDSLFESEMFGYEKGAFTGALQGGKKGLIEAADGGTLFLDEIGEVPLVMQAKMLKFLEAGSVQRVGAASERSFTVRVISATNRDLEAMVEQGSFRRDLYYRLAVVPLQLRALRESRELIPELLDHFVSLVNQRREHPLSFGPECLALLLAYAYPGNIRELQNIVQQISVRCDGVAGPQHLPDAVRNQRRPLAAPPQQSSGDLKSLVVAYESQIIQDAIARLGSKRKAAEALGVDIGTIVRKTQHLRKTPTVA